MPPNTHLSEQRGLLLVVFGFWFVDIVHFGRCCEISILTKFHPFYSAPRFLHVMEAKFKVVTRFKKGLQKIVGHPLR